jgi:hypothetical protein
MSSFDIEDDFAPRRRPTSRPASDPASPFGRTLPHSAEAEEYLLSCCLLDGSDTMDRCSEAKVAPAVFYVPYNRTIYEKLLEIHQSGRPVDLAVLAEELKTQRLLDGVGGYAYLTQISSRVPTTAQAQYFIDKLRELALLRELIKASTGVVEECFNYTGGIEEFVATRRELMDGIFDGVVGAQALAASCKFDPKAKIVDERIVYWLGETLLCTAGNLTNLTAQTGVGKSAVVEAMIAATMRHPKDTLADCLGFRANNERGMAVLHFDTEQSPSHYQRLLHRALRRSGANKFPDWFASYHLTGKSSLDCRELVRAMVRKAARQHGGIYAIFIDGWGDLCLDPNDSQEAFPFVTEMHAMAIKFDCPIIGVLHLNPGMEAKSRGHLGSQLERKCETVLKLEMDEDMITAVYSTKKRGKPIPKHDGPRFAWSTEHEMHRTVGDWQAMAAASRAEKKAAKKEKNPGAFDEKFSREEQVGFYPASTEQPANRAVIFRRAQEATHISTASLDRLRREFLANGWTNLSNGQYRRTADGDLWAQRRPKPEPKDDLPLDPDRADTPVEF